MVNTSQTHLENTLVSIITQEIGPNAVKIVKKRLLEKYGTTILEAVNEWPKIEDILVEQFAGGAEKIKSKYIAKITVSNPFQKNNGKNIIDDPKVADEILRTYGDTDSRKIMNYFTDNNCLIEEVIKNTKTPQTSGYRKIKKMIKMGIIIEVGHIIGTNNKKVRTYTTPFESLRIDIINSFVTVYFIPKKQMTKQLV